jgi:hypothetical protein
MPIRFGIKNVLNFVVFSLAVEPHEVRCVTLFSMDFQKQRLLCCMLFQAHQSSSIVSSEWKTVRCWLRFKDVSQCYSARQMSLGLLCSGGGTSPGTAHRWRSRIVSRKSEMAATANTECKKRE